MDIAVFLKNNLKNIPPSLGRIINRIPYGNRPGIGSVYQKRKKEIQHFEKANFEIRKDHVFTHFKAIVNHAYQNVKFYKNFYDKMGFHPNELQSFEDIGKTPIVTKDILNGYPLEERSFYKKDRYKVNTGGSSGTPFEFYIEPNSMGHEWAHMHTIWEKLDYKPSDLKLVFGGRSDVKNTIEYDVVRNSFALDIYADYDLLENKLIGILKKNSIKYLHGYPSSIYDFAVYCERSSPELKKLLRKNLKGAFLGSEYPHLHYRQKIEDVFDIKTISWYGHTERSVLAYEKSRQFEYESFLTYGFSEVVKNELNDFNLISTSYYNQASPLIRYNTEDIVQDPIYKGGLLKSFKILKGREGEFVIDKGGKKINLTGLIFGRHHEIFNYSKFIQVKQVEKGRIDIYYVSDISENEACNLFDANNLNFEINFVKVSAPIRSVSGKISLLIKNNETNTTVL